MHQILMVLTHGLEKVHGGNPKNYSFPGGLAYNEGRLFLSSRSGTVAALNASTGEILWKYSFDQPFRSYPLIYRKNIYVVSGDDLGVAFSRDGKILWPISGDIQTTSVSKSASPLANNGKVFAFHFFWKHSCYRFLKMEEIFGLGPLIQHQLAGVLP